MMRRSSARTSTGSCATKATRSSPLSTAGAALDLLAAEEIDLALLDLNLGAENGIDVLKAMKEIDPDLLVIVITGYGSVETAVESLKLGAFHYMKKPFKADALRLIVKLALQTNSLKREVSAIRKGELEFFEKVPMIGVSNALKQIMHQAREVARHPGATVLITGESGTGKELIAKSIHHLSERREAPFIEINCASIPVNLLESELFGHEKGAFTDAGSRKPGLFEMANKGTIFLDEVGEMEPAMQAKLLRVLENRTIRRVGGTKSIDVDVRVIAATNRNLQDAIQQRGFPRGPLLPAQCLSDPYPAAARTARRHPGPGQLFPGTVQPEILPLISTGSIRKRCASSPPTAGRATSGS